MKICSLCGSVLADRDTICPCCGEEFLNVKLNEEDISRKNRLLEEVSKSSDKVLDDKASVKIVLIMAVAVAISLVFSSITLNKSSKTDEIIATAAPAEVSEALPTVEVLQQPESGEIYADVFADKGSKGIFTNCHDSDVIVSCYYPKTNETVLEFYLRQGDAIEMDMPYATLEINIKNTDGELIYTIEDKIPFPIGQTVRVDIE